MMVTDPGSALSSTSSQDAVINRMRAFLPPARSSITISKWTQFLSTGIYPPQRIPDTPFFGERPKWVFSQETNKAVLSVGQTRNGLYYVTGLSNKVCFWRKDGSNNKSWAIRFLGEHCVNQFTPFATYEMLGASISVSLGGEDQPEYDEAVIVAGNGISLVHADNGCLKKAWNHNLVRCLSTMKSNFLLSANRNLLLCGCDDQLVVFDVDRWRTISSMKTKNTESNILAVCELSTNEALPQCLVLAATGNNIEMWDWSSKKFIRTFLGHAAVVTGLTEIPDTRTFASCAEDWCVCIWDRDTGERLKSWEAGKFRMRGIHSVKRHSPSSDAVLVTGSDDRMVRLWNTNGECLDYFNANQYVRSVHLLKDGQVVCGRNWGEAHLYDTYRKSV